MSERGSDRKVSETSEYHNAHAPGFHDLAKDTYRSPFQKYQFVNVGKESLVETLKYEMITVLLEKMPGAIGLYLRQKFYRFLFGSLGKGAVIGVGVTVRQPSGIFVGDNSILDSYAHLGVRGVPESRITIGNNVLIGRYCTLKTRGGVIEIGDHADIGEFCRVGRAAKVKIGRYSLIAAFCYIGASSHSFACKDEPIAVQGVKSKGGVVIGDDVWIGTHVTVLDGVTIGDGAIIGAHSLVTSDIPPYGIAYGTPARVVGSR